MDENYNNTQKQHEASSEPSALSSTSPQLCSMGCGFFSSAQYDGMCSKCFGSMTLLAANTATTNSPADNANDDTNYNLADTFDEDYASLQESEYDPVMECLTRLPVAPVAQTPLESSACTVTSSSTDFAPSNTPSIEAPPPATEKPAPPAGPSRCSVCRKRVGLTGFSCRCGGLFCSTHRYSDTHDCTFDYRADAAKQIQSANPVCLPKKIDRL